ncbi:hypothetical protein CSOJ01_00792 [Colletotrichum sojae]|uniref:Uncharacterized protein n=1 Tax=Colletotrichum sojae TaxID=2175907 RepID=A0A8H6JXB9_9PEZI|nr:hypothetical protein CSOJ01_00792 [Colletotrichum sojae]
MSRSLVGKALRAKPAVWEQPACALAQQQQQRSFTQKASSSEKYVHLFDEPSNTRLRKIFDDIQRYIILPSHMKSRHRVRVFDKREKVRTGIRKDPVYVAVDDVEFKYGEHIPGRDIPNAREMTWKALKTFKTQADWDNFGRLLAGMRRAKRRYDDVDYAKMVRIAGTKGHIYTILEAARQVRKTGFKLDTSEKVNHLLHFIQMRAIESGWEKEKTEQALRWAEMVVEMVEDPLHKPAPNPAVPAEQRMRWPLWEDPQVLGAALHLAAVNAVKHNGGEDVGGKVRKYAEQVVKRWPAGRGLRNLHPKGAYHNRMSGVAYLSESRTQYLCVAAPILHGLLLATRVVEKPLADKLQAIANGLAPEVNRQVAIKQYPARRGMATYEMLFKTPVKAGEAKVEDAESKEAESKEAESKEAESEEVKAN